MTFAFSEKYPVKIVKPPIIETPILEAERVVRFKSKPGLTESDEKLRLEAELLRLINRKYQERDEARGSIAAIPDR